MFWCFITLAVISVVAYVIVSMLIVKELQKRKVKINWFLLRLYLPKYASQYKQLTLQETGKAGGLYPIWLVSINATLAFVLLALVVKIITT